MTPIGENRVFLFLQGPHGPFFYKLGKMLRAAGAEVWRTEVGPEIAARCHAADIDALILAPA